MIVALACSFFMLLQTHTSQEASRSSYVQDLSHSLQPKTKALLEKQLASLEEQEGVQLVVVVVPTLEGKSIEEVSAQFFNRLQPGHLGRDSGILLLIAPKELNSYVELGYGL